MMGHVQDIQPGMAVYGSDLQRVGRITEVYPSVDWDTTPGATGNPVQDLSPGEAAVMSLTGPGYLEVIQEEGADEGSVLYIPISAVKSLAPAVSVVLFPDRAQALAVYQIRPDILGPEEPDDR